MQGLVNALVLSIAGVTTLLGSLLLLALLKHPVR